MLDFTGLGGGIPIVVKGDVSFGSGVVFAATSGVLAFGFGVSIEVAAEPFPRSRPFRVLPAIGASRLGGGVHHLLAHGDADAEVESGTAAAVGVVGRGFDRVGGLELRVLLHVSEDSHGGAFVEGGFDLWWEGNVFNEKLR